MLGAELCRVLSQEHETFGMLHQSQPGHTWASFIHGDITSRESLEQVIEKTSPEWVIHTAAWTDVDGCESNTEKAYVVNAQGTENVAQVCRQNNIGLVYISTDYVFDGERDTPYTEKDTPNPINSYGKTKLIGEQAVQSDLDRYFIVRTAWLFSEFSENFVSWVAQSLQRGDPIQVAVDQTGSPTYCKDLAQALAKLVKATEYGVYHIVNSGTTTRYGFAREIARQLEVDAEQLIPIRFEQLGRVAQRPQYIVLAPGRFEKICGYMPRVWQDALAEYLSA